MFNHLVNTPYKFLALLDYLERRNLVLIFIFTDTGPGHVQTKETKRFKVFAHELIQKMPGAMVCESFMVLVQIMVEKAKFGGLNGRGKSHVIKRGFLRFLLSPVPSRLPLRHLCFDVDFTQGPKAEADAGGVRHRESSAFSQRRQRTRVGVVRQDVGISTAADPL
jgi:hypothetical protein